MHSSRTTPIEDASGAAAEEAASSVLIDLSSQLRNLLLVQPLMQLELARNRYGDGGAMFEGLDTAYLCLAALNHMMEGAAVATGYTKPEVEQFLAQACQLMRPGIGQTTASRVASLVMDSLDNANNNYQPHCFEYFHAPSGTMRKLEFRLTAYEPDLEDRYRYHPTDEGYLVLMGMLELRVEDHQILVERMLQHLIERGRFEQAYDFARRARLLSIEHRQQLREFITQAWRAPGSVAWTSDIAPRLAEARQHISERQEEDRRMEESVRKQLMEVSDRQAREQLVRLHDALHGAAVVRMRLNQDVGGAGEKFLDAQASAFRARRPSGLPDLESKLLPQALEKPLPLLARAAEELILSFYPAVVPRLPDFAALTALLLEPRTSEGDEFDDDDDGSVVPFRVYADPFPQDTMDRVRGWIDSKLVLGGTWQLDELLAAAGEDGLTKVERQAVVYTLYRSFPESETLFPSMSSEVEGKFVSDVARGDNLRFEPRSVV